MKDEQLNVVVEEAKKAAQRINDKYEILSLKRNLTNKILSHDREQILDELLKIAGHSEMELETLYFAMQAKTDEERNAIVTCFANAFML